MHRPALPVGILILICAPVAWAADSPAPEAAATSPLHEWTWHLDPYDSSLGLNMPLSGKPIPTVQSDDYGVIFRDLMEDSLVPHYMQLQADAYPVPVLGTWLKSHSPHTYNKGDIANTGANLVESSSTDRKSVV